MKTAITLLAVVSCVFSSTAFANGWKTLAGFNDSITLKAGETAFIIGVSENVVLQYDKDKCWPPRPEQFRLGANVFRNGYSLVSPRRNTVIPTAREPFVLSGPAKVSLKTDGVLSMKVTSCADSK
jgi:hypothetical protein